MKPIAVFLFFLGSVTLELAAQMPIRTLESHAVDVEEEYIPHECSFYCGNFTHTESASSSLRRRGALRYDARQAHDGDLSTAWVEGRDGDGRGEFLEIVIDAAEHKGDPLKLTALRIYNGYRKNRATWRENSRVKRMNLYVDEKAYAVVNLKDSYNYQTVALDPIQLKAGKTKLRFEIVTVFEGSKYSDTAITEIVLDGCCVH